MNELVYILEAAQEHIKNYNHWYLYFLNNNDNDARELALFEHCKACGLLEAYQILTGYKIYTCDVKDELEKIA